jgi:hypothetical protein
MARHRAIRAPLRIGNGANRIKSEFVEVMVDRNTLRFVSRVQFPPLIEVGSALLPKISSYRWSGDGRRQRNLLEPGVFGFGLL